MGNKCCKSDKVKATQVKHEKETPEKDQKSPEELQKEIKEKEHQEMKEMLKNVQQDLGEHKKMLTQQSESFNAHTKRETDTMEKLLGQLQSYENQLVTHEKRLKVTENSHQQLERKIDNLTLKLNSNTNSATALQEFKEKFQSEQDSYNKRSMEEKNQLMTELKTLASEQNDIKNQIERILQMIAELKKNSVPPPIKKQVSFKTTPPKTHFITRHKHDNAITPTTSDSHVFECHLNEEICEWYKTTKNNMKACYGAFTDSEQASLHRSQEFSSKGLLQFICLQNPRHNRYKCHICRHIDLSDVPALP
jgi:myosin heavy subunit